MLIFSTLLELLAAAIVLLPVYCVLHQTRFHNLGRSFLYGVFSFYLVAVYALVGMPNVTYVRFEINLNLIPLVGMIADLKNSILNILLFVPLGVMLPVLWVKYRKAKNTVLFGFGMSLAIEMLQMFTYRATDINDLITNTLGALLGWLLAGAWMRKCPGVKRLGEEKNPGEVYLVCGIVGSVMFFVQPFLFSLLWDWIMH